MSGDERTELAEWERTAEVAAAAGPRPLDARDAHLADAIVAQVRGGDESAELDEAYRHLASCAVCRARLAEPAAEVAALVKLADAPAVAPGPQAASVARVPEARAKVVSLRRRTWVLGLAAAAAAVLAVGAATRAPWGGAHDDRVAIVQTASAGWMGSEGTGAGAVAAEDRNVEIRVAPGRFVAGVLATYDEAGHPLASPRPFAREASGALAVVVAPRTFAAHTGSAVGLVVLGTEEAVRAAGEEARRGDGSLDAREASLRARVGAEGHVERITIGAAP